MILILLLILAAIAVVFGIRVAAKLVLWLAATAAAIVLLGVFYLLSHSH